MSAGTNGNTQELGYRVQRPKGLRRLVEVFSGKKPTTAREFVGFPIQLEERYITPVEDDRIMADGRPAYAWWNEIQMLRQRESELHKRDMDTRKRIIALRIAEWAVERDILTDDTLIRIKRLPLTAKDPLLDLMEHPEKYVTVAGHL
jgi:hypothetical protein